MKIKSLSTKGFGKFKNETWEDFNASINVFYGENEAGKSTVFRMLTEMMFGFKQKNAKRNLLINRDSQMLQVSSSIENDGQIEHLDRDFNDGLNLKITKNQKEFVYGNVPLPIVEHVTRATYEEIYALDLNRLSNFQDATWEDVEDLLMQQFSGDTFKSPKQVMHQLEEEMKKIKRQSDRGNSILKTLEEDRRQVFKKKKVIQNNLEQVDVLNEKLLSLNRQIEEIKIKKMKWVYRYNLLEVYLPLMRLLKEKRELEKSIESFKDFEGLDEHQYKEKKKSIKALYSKMDELSEKVSKFIYEKRKILERLKSDALPEIEFNEIYQKYLSLEKMSEEVEVLNQRLLLNEHSFKKDFENTFDERFDSKHYDEILTINYLNLKSLINEIEDLYEEIKILKRHKRTGNTSNPNGKIVLMVILAIASGFAFYLDYGKILNSVSMVMIGISFVVIINLLLKKRHKLLDEDDLFMERDELRRRLVKELNGIRLSSIAEEFIGHEFLTQVLGLKTLAEQHLKDVSEYEVKNSYFTKVESEVQHYVKTYCGDLSKNENPFDTLSLRVEENKKNQSRVAVINGQLDMLNDQLQELEKQLNEEEAWLSAAESFLLEYGENDLSVGLEKLKSKDLWLLRHAELDKKISSVDYSEHTLKEFVVAFNTRTDERQFDRTYIQTELDIINKVLNDKIIESAAIEKDVKLLLDQSDLSKVQSELLSLDTQLEKEKMRYDQLLLLHYIISVTEEAYRQENQPEVFKNAGDYLGVITDGKYHGLEVVETDSKKTKYEIQVTKDHQSVRVDESFSMGTLNQIYLSLRLSLIDHIDKDHTNLPICFDELLVNWDKKRLDKTLEIIEMVSKKRQVIIFTCHDWFLKSLMALEDVKVFNL